MSCLECSDLRVVGPPMKLCPSCGGTQQPSIYTVGGPCPPAVLSALMKCAERLNDPLLPIQYPRAAADYWTVVLQHARLPGDRRLGALKLIRCLMDAGEPVEARRVLSEHATDLHTGDLSTLRIELYRCERGPIQFGREVLDG